MVYNLADTFFIGRTDDPYKIAAATLSYTLCYVMNALSNLFGIGGGSLISRLLGKEEPEEARKVCAFSFYGAILVAFFYVLSCFVCMEPLLRLLGASDNTLGYASSYTFWVIVVGGIPSTLSITMAHLLRSEGYAKRASFGLGLGGILNIFLDPLFMFVLLPAGREVTGAALATMLSNFVTLGYFAISFRKLRATTVTSASVRQALLGLRYIGAIFAVGLPSALGSLLASISNLVINNLASNYGDISVAALGIVKKIEMLPMNVGMGLCQGMLPLVAYNYAAGNYKRMKSVIKQARFSGMGFAILCIVVFELFSKEAIQLFLNDPGTVALGADFLRINCIAIPFMICNFQMSYTFQAMGKGTQSLILSSCRQGIINIPLLFLMNACFGLYGLPWTQFLADGVTLLLSFSLYRRVVRNLEALV